jgi:hypothetical protein
MVGGAVVGGAGAGEEVVVLGAPLGPADVHPAATVAAAMTTATTARPRPRFHVTVSSSIPAAGGQVAPPPIRFDPPCERTVGWV